MTSHCSLPAQLQGQRHRSNLRRKWLCKRPRWPGEPVLLDRIDTGGLGDSKIPPFARNRKDFCPKMPLPPPFPTRRWKMTLERAWRDGVQRPGRNVYTKGAPRATGTSNESWYHQRSNPGTFNQITPAVVGIEPLRQVAVSEIHTTVYCTWQKNRKIMYVYIRV